MKCPQCGFQNENSAIFCGNCGSSLQPASHDMSGKIEKQENSSQIRCASCGAINGNDSQFCYNCGTRIELSHAAGRQTRSQNKTSGAWWLMPIFLGWLGGLVAWLVVRESNQSKAKKLLWTGIIMTLFWIIVVVLTNMAAFFLGFDY